MTALDELIAIDDAASPGPWTVNDSNENGDRYVGPDPAYCLIVMSPEHLMLGAKGDTEATAQLAALSKFLRPAFEALEYGAMRCCALKDDGEVCSEIATAFWYDEATDSYACPAHDNDKDMLPEHRQDWEGGERHRAVLASLEEALR